jgi:hypothetical protein
LQDRSIDEPDTVPTATLSLLQDDQAQILALSQLRLTISHGDKWFTDLLDHGTDFWLHRVGTSNYITPITQAINDLLMFS